MNSIYIALKNTFHSKKRSALIVSGIAMALTFIYMEVGFFESGKRLTTLVYDFFEFDLILVSKRYQAFFNKGRVDRLRLASASSAEGVLDTAFFSASLSFWEASSGKKSSALLISVPENSNFFSPILKNKTTTSLFTGTGTVLIDRLSSKHYGDLNVGTKGKIGGFNVTIIDQFDLGYFFFADGALMVSNDLFYSILSRDPRLINFGLIKAEEGQDIQELKQTLKERLPDDIKIMTKSELYKSDQSFFIKEKSMGVLFQVGMLISFSVGAVILFQNLLSEVKLHLPQYATLSAMGFSQKFIYSITIWQAFFIIMTSFIIATLISIIIYAQIKLYTGLPMQINISTAINVLLLGCGMCFAPILFALDKLRRSMNIAELF